MAQSFILKALVTGHDTQIFERIHKRYKQPFFVDFEMWAAINNSDESFLNLRSLRTGDRQYGFGFGGIYSSIA